MSLNVKFWGVRGSLPSPHVPADLDKRIENHFANFFESGYKSASDIKTYLGKTHPFLLGGVGGNTTCVEVSTKDSQVIIDGGTGIRLFGYTLLSGACGRGQGIVRILLTHFHWDHVIGLPFFVPIFIPGNEIHFYSVEPDLEEVIRSIFRKPLFPVEYEKLGARIIFHNMQPRRTTQFGNLSVTPYKLDHPDPCWGYKFENDGKTFSYCADTEGIRISRTSLGEDLALYQGTDAMAFDAQYTLSQTIEKSNWGHSAATIGLDIAFREKIKKLYFVHHDPNASDEAILAASNQTRTYYDRMRASRPELPEVDWTFVREGSEITI
jgi:phosphoribosyl 1,2-cyclic phosphodiesterase